jgi:hypothetical protein
MAEDKTNDPAGGEQPTGDTSNQQATDASQDEVKAYSIAAGSDPPSSGGGSGGGGITNPIDPTAESSIVSDPPSSGGGSGGGG